MPKGIKGYQKGHPTFISKETYKAMGEKRKGIKFSDEHKRKIGEANKDNLTGLKNGELTRFNKIDFHACDLVGGLNQYRYIHKWVEKKLGKPTKCSCCGEDGLTERQIHWANLSKEYKKDIKDWVRLCVKCHYNIDLNRVILPINFYVYEAVSLLNNI